MKVGHLVNGALCVFFWIANISQEGDICFLMGGVGHDAKHESRINAIEIVVLRNVCDVILCDKMGGSVKGPFDLLLNSFLFKAVTSF